MFGCLRIFPLITNPGCILRFSMPASSVSGTGRRLWRFHESGRRAAARLFACRRRAFSLRRNPRREKFGRTACFGKWEMATQKSLSVDIAIYHDDGRFAAAIEGLSLKLLSPEALRSHATTGTGASREPHASRPSVWRGCSRDQVAIERCVRCETPRIAR